ncbi:carboxylesterase/lipase family protein [Kribbella solani]|uniref:carboxylesterase/lipase family protein n=1 Tax=Kribbella solani TaxID=236067 RepID=UPI0029BD4D18|nr:carboxylesterase family protein [Kribbella solani]MDX2968769.1 carboxylesterase family protein [Kribbella solani]
MIPPRRLTPGRLTPGRLTPSWLTPRQVIPILLALASIAGALTTAAPPSAAAPLSEAVLAAATAERQYQAGPRVRVAEGVLRGVEDSASVRFLGVPYASAKRWSLPARPAHWRGVRAAVAPGAVCEQAPKTLEPGATPSEDCLFLNVTAPRRHSSGPGPMTAPRRQTGGLRPVVVYLHGGGFVQGSGSYLDARRMAVVGDVVVVTPNYRLGIFGNLALPGMPEVNLGLRDQLAALRWVRANIRAFGGDPANVTLSGESAGGLSTCTLLASPAAAGLFAKAIVSSGSCATSYAPYSIDSQIPVEVSTWYDRGTTDAMGTAAARSLGCTDARTALACLRRLPADRLVPLTSQFGLLSIGTPTVSRAPRTQLRAAWARNVPVLAGNTADEHLGWIFPAYPAATAATYRQVIRSGFGVDAAAVERQYPLNRYRSPIVALGHIYSDRNWICPTVEAQRVYARTAPTWTYLFADPAAPTIDGTKVPRPSTPHGSDVAYTFPDPAVPLTRAQRALGDRFIRAWATFARTGAVDWPQAGARQFAPRDSQVDPDTTHHCAFWRTLDQAAAGTPVRSRGRG